MFRSNVFTCNVVMGPELIGAIKAQRVLHFSSFFHVVKKKSARQHFVNRLITRYFESRQKMDPGTRYSRIKVFLTAFPSKGLSKSYTRMML